MLSISLPPNMAGRVDAKDTIFLFPSTTALSPKLSLKHSADKLKSGLLEQKDLASVARFQSIRE